MTWYIKWKQKSEIEVDQDLYFEHGEIFSFLQWRNVVSFLPQKHNLVRIFLAGCCARFSFLMGITSFSGHVQILFTLQAESIKFSPCQLPLFGIFQGVFLQGLPVKLGERKNETCEDDRCYPHQRSFDSINM